MRVTVYEMCFAYPAPLKFRARGDWHDDPTAVHMSAREVDLSPENPKRRSGVREWIDPVAVVGSIDKILGLLRVNKQIYGEAKGIFQARNTSIFNAELGTS